MPKIEYPEIDFVETDTEMIENNLIQNYAFGLIPFHKHISPEIGYHSGLHYICKTSFQ